MKIILRVLFVSTILWSTCTYSQNLQREEQLELDWNLIEAVKSEDQVKIKDLLLKGANPSNTSVIDRNSHCPTKFSKPAIHFALNSLLLLKIIIENSSVDLNIVSKSEYCTGEKSYTSPLLEMLQWHYRGDFKERFEYLVKNGADVNLVIDGESILTYLIPRINEYEANIFDTIEPHLSEKNILSGFSEIIGSNRYLYNSINWLLSIAEKHHVVPNTYYTYRNDYKTTFLDYLLGTCVKDVIPQLKKAIELGASPLHEYNQPFYSLAQCENEELNIDKFNLISHFKLDLTPKDFVLIARREQFRLAKLLYEAYPISPLALNYVAWWRYDDDSYSSYLPLYKVMSLTTLNFLKIYGATFDTFIDEYKEGTSLDGHTLLTHVLRSEESDEDKAAFFMESSPSLINTPTGSLQPEFPHYTPLMFAVRKNFEWPQTMNIIQLLLISGADTSITNDQNETALYIFFERIRHDNVPSVDMIKKLVTTSTNIINTVTKSGYCDGDSYLGWNSFHQFIYTSGSLKKDDREEVAKLLVNCGADLSIKDRIGRTILATIDDCAEMSEEDKRDLKIVIENAKPNPDRCK